MIADTASVSGPAEAVAERGRVGQHASSVILARVKAGTIAKLGLNLLDLFDVIANNHYVKVCRTLETLLYPMILKYELE